MQVIGSFCRIIRQDDVLNLLWVLPIVVLISVVILYPAIFIIWLSVQHTRFYEVVGFAGLENYAALLRSREFWVLSVNSMIYVFGTLAIVIPMGIACALLIQALRWAGNMLRIALLIPWTLSQAVVGTFWLWLLNPTYGPIAYWMMSIGIKPGLMLGDPTWAIYLVIAISVWWSFPYATILFNAALLSIPKELFEAVEIDGGGSISRFRYVVLPHLVPTIGSVALALGILYLTLVTLIIILTGGGPFGSTATWSFAVFQGTVRSIDIAPASALATLVMAMNLILGIAYIWLTKRVTA